MITNTVLEQLLKTPTWVIFTSQNPDNKQLSPVENASLLVQLKRNLSVLGCDYEDVFGQYGGKGEEGVILYPVAEVTRDLAAQIARYYGQESVLTHEGLVYQNGTCNPIVDWSFPLTQPEDDYTLLRSTYVRANINFDVLL